MNVYKFQERCPVRGMGSIRKVRARHESGARGRLPRPTPGFNWILVEVQKPLEVPNEIPVVEEQIVPLTWGQGGPVIGSAHVLSTGRIIARLDTIGTDMGVNVSKALGGVSFEGSIVPYFKGE